MALVSSLQPLAIHDRSAIVGRGRELNEASVLLNEALGGRGGLLLLAGEPGIGKTRLMEAIASDAMEKGCRVSGSRCYDGGPPYWPWTQLLRDCLESVTVETPGARVRPAVDYISRLLPESSFAGFESGQVSVTVPVLEGSVRQNFRLFDSIGTVLRWAAEAKPLMLAIDDLHMADPDSLLLLGFLARDLRRTRIVVVVTYRDVEVQQSPRHSAFLSEIAREGTLLRLSGLDESEVAQFLRRSRPNTDASLVHSLTQTTGGNPYFIEEMIRELPSNALPQERNEKLTVRMPSSVRAMVVDRVDRLNQVTKTVLNAASVVGTEFDLRLLEMVTSLTYADLLRALGEAATHALVAESADSPGRYCFNHGVVPEAIRTTLETSTLKRLHYEIGTGIERLSGNDSVTQLDEIAHHYFQAIPIAPAGKTLEFCRAAADRAQQQCAYEQAAQLYEMALATTESLRPPDDVIRCDVLIRLANARAAAGRVGDESTNLQRAIEIARRLRRRDLFGRAALAWGKTSGGLGVADHRLILLLEEALSSFGEQEGVLRAMLLARLAADLFWTDQRERGVRLMREAVEVARNSADPATLVYALWSRHWMLWGPDNIEQRLATATEIAHLAEQVGDWESVLRARELRLAASLELGEIYDVDAEIAACEEVIRSTGISTGCVERFRAMRALMRGDFADAERWLEKVLAIGQHRQDPTLFVTYAGQIAQLRSEQGRTAEIEHLLRPPADQLAAQPVVRCGIALFYARSERIPEARIEFEYLAADDFSKIPADWNWLGTIALTSEVCARIEDQDRARLLYKILVPHLGRSVTLGWGDVYYGPVALYLALLSTTTGDFDRAEGHFESALRMNSRLGAGPCGARIQIAFAAMMLERNRKGDRERILANLNSAFETVKALKMNGLLAQIDKLQKRAEERMPEKDEAKTTARIVDPRPTTRFQRRGDVWTISWQDKTIQLRHLGGLDSIGYLLARPNRDVPVNELSTASHPVQNSPGAIGMAQAEGIDTVGNPGDAGPMLDPKAKQEYRQRLADLREELDEAISFNDSGRVERSRGEIDFIETELSRAIGLGGRDRKAVDVSERARVRITNAIRAAIARINEYDSKLADHLQETIKTGRVCSYRPDPGAVPDWEF